MLRRTAPYDPWTFTDAAIYSLASIAVLRSQQPRHPAVPPLSKVARSLLALAERPDGGLANEIIVLVRL